MKYKILGKSGIKVSELCLGAMTFGNDWGFGASKEESKLIFDTFLNKGGNFIDTANIYTKGNSERILSELIQTERDNLVIASKYSLTEGSVLNRSGNSRKNLIHSVDESLKRLNTDYIDLYYVHCWDFTTDPYELMKSLEYLVSSGKVLTLGISDTPAWIIAKCNTIAQEKGWTPFAANQFEYCLSERTADRELLPMTKDYGMTMCGFGPLGAGLLTGKYLTENDEPKRMKPGVSHRLSEENLALSARLSDFSQSIDRTPSQVAIRWAMQKFRNNSPIFGARSNKQCEENLVALDFTLSEDQMNQLDTMSAIPGNNPQTFYKMPRVQEILYANQRDKVEI